MAPRYYAPSGGVPGQDQLLTDRAVFTEAYAVIPKGVMRDIVTSALPFWQDTRAWILARPLSGFAETFSQYIMEVAPGGGSDRPDTEPGTEAAIFVVEGRAKLSFGGKTNTLAPGGFAFLPAGTEWRLWNKGKTNLKFHWIRKAFQPIEGLASPDPIISSDSEVAPSPMPGSDGRWATTRFFDHSDLRYDMHVTIVTFEPGGVIPFAETHVMEHGL